MNKIQKKILLALAAVSLTAPALADDFHKVIDLPVNSGGLFSSGFSSTHLEQGAFTDTYTFQLSDPADLFALEQTLYTLQAGSQVSASSQTANNAITFYSFTLAASSTTTSLPAGGAASASTLFAVTSSNTSTSWLPAGGLAQADPLQGLTLTVSGFAGADAIGAISASYGGTLNGRIAAAVPEPGSAAMLLAGLLSVGWIARRRIKN